MTVQIHLYFSSIDSYIKINSFYTRIYYANYLFTLKSIDFLTNSAIINNLYLETMRRVNNQRTSARQISPAHADLLQALNFSIMYRIYKEQQNIQSLKLNTSKTKTNTKSNTQTNKTKKGPMFQRPTKTRTPSTFQKSTTDNFHPKQPPRNNHNTSMFDFDLDPKLTKNRDQKHYETNTKSLNQFVNELSTPTASYNRINQSYLSYQKSNLDRSNRYEFNQSNIGGNEEAPRYSPHSRVDDYNVNNPRNNYIDTNANTKLQRNKDLPLEKSRNDNISIQEPLPKSKQPQRFQKKKPSQKQKQKERQRDHQNNSIHYPTTHSQKQFPYSERETDLESIIKSYRSKIVDLESQRQQLQQNTKPSIPREQYYIPEFGLAGVKVTDWTKKINQHFAEDDDDCNKIYQNRPRDIYQPSPTKSSSLASRENSKSRSKKHDFNKKTSKRRQHSDSEDDQTPLQSSQQKTFNNKNNDRNAFKQSHNRSHELLPKQIAVRKSNNPKYEKPRKRKSSSSSNSNYSPTPGTYPNFNNPSPRSQSPSPSPQPPRPKVQKPLAPKIPYSTSQKQICKFSHVSSQNESFDSQFRQQISDLNKSNNTNHLQINLTKHIRRCSSSSSDQTPPTHPSKSGKSPHDPKKRSK